jgi:hypothetical protein
MSTSLLTGNIQAITRNLGFESGNINYTDAVIAFNPKKVS